MLSNLKCTSTVLAVQGQTCPALLATFPVFLNHSSVCQANILFTFNNLAMSLGNFPNLYNSAIAIFMLKISANNWKSIKVDA